MSEKKQAKTIIFATFISVAVLFFSSCLNLFEETSFTDISGSAVGHISIENNAPVEIDNSLSLMINRTAFPSIPTGSTISYYAEVTDTASSDPVTWTGAADFSDFPAYKITGLETGVLWKIEIGIKDGSSKILKDSHTMTSALTAEDPVYSHDFELKPSQTAATGDTPAGKGNISLEIELESDSQITKCITSLSTDEFSPESNIITVSKTDVTSGSHTVDFTFYSADSEVLYHFTESLNIFDNMTTNTWVRNSGTEGSPYLVEETVAGSAVIKCRITNAMVQAFRMTTFYVKYDGNTEGTGTYFNPLQSIQGAITHMYNKDLDYRIFVMGSYNGSLITIPYDFKKDTSGNNHARSLTICGYDGLDENCIPRNTIGGLGFGVQPVFNNQSNVPLVFKNLKITNGKSGISNNSSGDVTLDDGVYITGNETAVGGNSFSMKGSAYIASDNPVSLETALSDVTFKINIAGQLTKHSSEDKIKVIPTSYTRGSVIVEADGTNVTDLTSVKDCFEIVNTDWYTILSADKSKIVINAPFFVAPASSAPSGYGSGSDTTGNGSRANPYESIYRVTRDIHSSNIALDYTIKIAGTISGSQHIVKNGDSVYTDYSANNVINTDNAASITIIGARDLPDDGKPLDGISCGEAKAALYFSATDVPLTLKNIYLTDGCTGLRVSSSASVYIEEGTEIKENSRANGSYLAKGILMTGGTLYIKGGEIHDNRMSESGYTTMAGGLKLDGVTLYMSGGKIYNNTGYSGGGIANYYGTVYIYGSAIIGDENATNCAGTTNATRSNFATEEGGGIYSTNDYTNSSKIPKVYIGYKPNEEGNPVVDEDFTGGIYYNSAQYGGGIANIGRYNINSPELYIAKGTIAYNFATIRGGAIESHGALDQQSNLYISGGVIKENKVDTTNNTTLGGAVYANNFYLSGDASIPAGVTDESTHVLATGKQLNDVYLDSGYKITITGKLEPPEDITATITPSTYIIDSELLVLRESPAPDPTTTIEEASACFDITPDTTNYYVVDGKLSELKSVSSFTNAPASGIKVAATSVDDFATIKSWVQDSSTDGLAGVTIKLVNNLTIDSTFNNSIGTNSKPFKGTFDGNRKTVTYENPSYSIIGYTSTGAVLKNFNLTGEIKTASLADNITGTIVENCTSSCNVTRPYDYAGGLISKASSTDTTSTATEKDCIIKDCIYTGTLTANSVDAYYIGGIVGDATLCKIQNCEMSGSVTGGTCVGGIVGFVSGKGDGNYGCLVENCCVTGSIESIRSQGSCGGIVGGTTTGTSCPFNCCFTGTLISASGKRGGITGTAIAAKCTNCYYVGDNTLNWNSENTSANQQIHRVTAITSDVIASLNEHNLTTSYASVASPSVYRQWTLDSSGKPKLVR